MAGSFPCLSEDGLKMARELMLSQAQLCFYERAVQDMKKGTMKQSIVAKLAKQTSVYYYATAVACRAPSLAHILDTLWLSVAEFQSKCFEGAAEYWQAQACRKNADTKGRGHGEDIARYRRAEAFVAQALENAAQSNLTGPLPSSVGTFLQAIRTNQATAEENLRSTGLDAYPLDSPLKAISAVSMVVPAVLRDLTLLHECEAPLFAFLVASDNTAPASAGPPTVTPTAAASSAAANSAPSFTNTNATTMGPTGFLASVQPISYDMLSVAPFPTPPFQQTARPQYEPMDTSTFAATAHTHAAAHSAALPGGHGYNPEVQSQQYNSNFSPAVSSPSGPAIPSSNMGVTASTGREHSFLPPPIRTNLPHTSSAPTSTSTSAQQGITSAANNTFGLPSAHPITGRPIWYFALDFMGIPPQYPLYRFTETSFSIVSGGVLHEATSYDFDRTTRRFKCHVFIWDFDIVFAADMSCIESGVCLQHSDRTRGIPRDFWSYTPVTDMDNNKLHIVRCDANGQFISN